jgi:predicted permease
MTWLKEGWRRIRSLCRRDELDGRLDEEIRFHLDQLTERNRRAGLSPSEARRRALLAFGGREGVREQARDQLRFVILEDLLLDLRVSLRSLRRAPGFTMLASLTLALGIGATTAIFSVLNGVVIKPLPYPDADELVAIWQTAPGMNAAQLPLSASQYVTYREQNRTFQEMGAWTIGPATVTGRAGPEEVRTLLVTDGTLQALAVQPAIGRWFSERDHAPGSPAPVMLTHGYWQRRYGGDSSVVGQTLVVNSVPRPIIGVMPASFLFPDATRDIILSLQVIRNQLSHGPFILRSVGRLNPGVTIAQADADIARMIALWLEAPWRIPPGVDAKVFEDARIAPRLRSLKHDVIGDIGNALWILLGTIGVVLVIACANVANLLLVRAEARQREFVVRTALGAGWSRLARGLLLESLLLALLGGAVGLVLSTLALRVLVAIAPAGLPRLDEVGIDPVVLAFALIVSLGSGALFGLVPAVRYAGPWASLHPTAGDARAGDTRERRRVKHALVVAQVALALVLLIGSGLLVRTFVALRAIQPGFVNPDHIQLVRITFPPAHVGDPERVFHLQREILSRMAAVPGVTASSFITTAPMGGFNRFGPILLDEAPRPGGTLPVSRAFKFVAPGYFRTVGTRQIAGRDFTWTDLDERRPVVVISENLARELWGEPSQALGKRLRESPSGLWREIVGVVADLYEDGVHAPAPAIVYWPTLLKAFEETPVSAQRLVAFTLRSPRAGTESFMKELQDAIWAADPGLPLGGARTLGADYQRSFARTRFTLVMLAIAAAMALLLGLVGIYGVIAYTVAQRTREIGIRVALGAPHAALKRMFVGEGLTLAAAGVVCGLMGAVLLTRLMASLLFGTGPFDLITYVGVSLALLLAAAIASYLPARKAATVNPVVALRAE